MREEIGGDCALCGETATHECILRIQSGGKDGEGIRITSLRCPDCALVGHPRRVTPLPSHQAHLRKSQAAKDGWNKRKLREANEQMFDPAEYSTKVDPT